MPTLNQDRPVAEEQSRKQLESFSCNCEENGVEYLSWAVRTRRRDIVGPNRDHQPGMTIVCGDSHTSTHWAFGAVHSGIGTSEVEWYSLRSASCSRSPKRCVSP